MGQLGLHRRPKVQGGELSGGWGRCPQVYGKLARQGLGAAAGLPASAAGGALWRRCAVPLLAFAAAGDRGGVPRPSQPARRCQHLRRGLRLALVPSYKEIQFQKPKKPAPKSGSKGQTVSNPCPARGWKTAKSVTDRLTCLQQNYIIVTERPRAPARASGWCICTHYTNRRGF